MKKATKEKIVKFFVIIFIVAMVVSTFASAFFYL